MLKLADTVLILISPSPSNVNIFIKSNWVNIPTVPICSDGPEAAAAAPSRGRPRGRLHPKVHMLRESLLLFGVHFCKKCKVGKILPLICVFRLLQCILSISPASVHQFYANILVFVLYINTFLYTNDQFALDKILFFNGSTNLIGKKNAGTKRSPIRLHFSMGIHILRQQSQFE